MTERREEDRSAATTNAECELRRAGGRTDGRTDEGSARSANVLRAPNSLVERPGENASPARRESVSLSICLGNEKR